MNVSLQRVLRWIALHVLFFKPTLGFFVAGSPTPITVSTKLSLFTTLGLKSESFVHFSFALRAVRFSTFRRACHHSKIPQLHPTNLQFPGQPLQQCSNGTDSTSNAVACPVVQVHSCKLPFGYHHLHVHRFVSHTPQHFRSIVED